ncbi:MAG TPA: hypothetical protein VKB69_12545 [Micromonosporaceae bacterium]|nr:hypothetical protein [Micromonosporaceae bacterium]
MSTPYQQMYPVSGGRVNGRDNALFIGVLVSAVLYVIACVVRLYAAASLNGMIHQRLNGDGSVDQAKVDSMAKLADNSRWAALFLLLLTLVLFIAFYTTLNRRLALMGSRGSLSRTPAFVTWRVGVVVSLVLSLFLNATVNTSSLEALSSALDKDMFYYALRAAIGCVYIWCAFSMRKAAERFATATPAFPSRPNA